jgi:2-polyprenyl-3-methyl-5-hydroxy-6-metoxy-1,4-benzoquinol methylase
MPTEDASRWNKRYQEENRNSFERPRRLLIDYANLLPKQGLALDIAMGLGGNANFLLQHGLHVIGVDISHIAIHKAKTTLPDLMAVIADLEHFYIPSNTFDVIISFLYLQKDIWLPMVQGLKPNGILFIETLTENMHATHPEIETRFLLKPGELREAFTQSVLADLMEILAYQENWQETTTSHPRAVASLVARRRH